MSGVVLNFSICPSCSTNSLTFTETTGAYSINNLTGWNTPNSSATACTSAKLDIYFPGSVTPNYTINLFALTGPTTQYPTANDITGYVITAQSLGLSNITDGIWQFTYTVVTGDMVPLTLVTTQNIFLYCNVECCFQQLIQKIGCCNCSPCEEKHIDKALKAWALLEGIKCQAIMGNTSNFTQCLTALQNLCQTSGCGGCKGC